MKNVVGDVLSTVRFFIVNFFFFNKLFTEEASFYSGNFE